MLVLLGVFQNQFEMWLRSHASEPKGHEFEPHSYHLVRTYGRRYVQVRPKISQLKKNMKKTVLNEMFNIKALL